MTKVQLNYITNYHTKKHFFALPILRKSSEITFKSVWAFTADYEKKIGLQFSKEEGNPRLQIQANEIA